MKDEESELADELFDVVKKLIDRSCGRSWWRVDEQGIYFSDLPLCISQWRWSTKEEFLLDRPGQNWMSFAKTCMCHNIVSSFGASLGSAVRIMADSSSLEEIRLKFAAAGLLPERTR